MAEKTGIAWCDSTFNCWIGCTKVSPGCDHCYAEALDKRHRWGGATHWGAGVKRMRTSESYWKQPLAWNRKAEASGKPWRVFCASLADVFDNEVPEDWRHDLWTLIERTPHLTWLVLTKRIGNAAKMLPRRPDWSPTNDGPWNFPNLWLGASVVNQEEADRDIPKLLATPAAKRFVSYEPALGPVNWEPWLGDCDVAGGIEDGFRTWIGRGLDQIIVGGESRQGSPLARPFKHKWARSTLSQCRAAGVAFFMKQTGSDYTALYERVQKDRAGADPAEWPADLRVQEFPA